MQPLLSPLDNFLFLDPCLSIPSSPLSDISLDIEPIRVVCNVPLLAPRPLPYHSPTFLQFDLPDTDEDLSHPPYTHRPPKRKRDFDDDPQPQPKRRTGNHRWRSRPTARPWDRPSPAHRSSNHPSRS
ncbi:hypothetical protein JVU11DRAFT_346 [Chiua virens]|nr:hypothetical protein JVU11DRAFT_346 [Chiua virens]